MEEGGIRFLQSWILGTFANETTFSTQIMDSFVILTSPLSRHQPGKDRTALRCGSLPRYPEPIATRNAYCLWIMISEIESSPQTVATVFGFLILLSLHRSANEPKRYRLQRKATLAAVAQVPNVGLRNFDIRLVQNI